MVPRIGKYTLEKVLGAGSFGEVYQAFDPDLQKYVAIKKLKVRGDQQADVSVQFTREARDTSKLAHQNIVTVHGFGVDEADGGPYLVMELLEGQTLRHLIRKGPAMTLVEKLEIMHQVAEGLQFAHARGVIHRDIKPANIMVLPDGTAKVMDFAVAPEGYLIGTPAYMAPEQFAGRGSDVLTDVFAFGTVYYEVLTGARAFDPKQPDRSQTSHYEPPPVSEYLKDCPPWLDLLLAKLIAKRRDRRMDTLEEMLVETRPTLQRLKQDRAAEMAAGIAPLAKAGSQEAANQLIAQVLRLDPLNREARAWRVAAQGEQREEARARAQDLVRHGEAECARGEFASAVKTFGEALELDIGNPAIEKMLDTARGRAEDCRTADRLLGEVLEEVIAAGPKGMPPWQVETAFQKLTRATRLDENNAAAMALRLEMNPLYERVRDVRMTAPVSAPLAQGSEYEQRLAEARKARRNREFDYAQDILSKLMEHAPDDRAQRELSAVIEDRGAARAEHEALGRASLCKLNRDWEGAMRELDAFAELYPRRAKAVENERRALQAEIERLS